MMLLNDKKLERSSVVANCSMNRERKAFGINSYHKEISLNPLSFMKNRAERNDGARWLDICCGRGSALIQVAEELQNENINQKVFLTGVDLAGMFDPISFKVHNVNLIESSLSEFETPILFDLITCVHGMHYIGDKLGMIMKYMKMLKPDGCFVCNMDTNDIFDKKGRKLGRKINSVMRNQGLLYDSKRKLLKCERRIELDLPFEYVGADDRYGRNYTGQHTVSSYYSLIQK